VRECERESEWVREKVKEYLEAMPGLRVTQSGKFMKKKEV